MTDQDQQDPPAGSRPYLSVLVTLVIADIAYAFQQTAIIPAIPTVAHALHATEAWSAWLISAYLMLATVATPALGRYADLHGRKRTLVAALVVFLVGSFGAALSPDIATLIVFRAVQGVGGAVFPLAFAVVRDTLPYDRVPTAIGALTGAFGIGTALGFGLGGLLAEVSWRLIFAIGAVLVGVGSALVAAYVPRSGGAAGGRFDVRGTVLVGGCAVAVLLALTLGVQIGWRSPVTIVLLVASVVAGAWWVRVELRVTDPLVDLRVFRARPVLLTNIATVGLGWALFGGYFLVPQFVRAVPSQAHYGFAASATVTGLYLLPAAIGQLVAGPAAGPLARRFSGSRVFAAGLGVVAVALAVLGTTGHSSAQVLIGTLLLGLGAGLAIQTSSSVVTQGVAAEQTSTSTALNSTIRRFAGGIGGQISAILLAAVAIASGTVPSQSAFAIAFLTAAGLALLGGALALLMPAERA